MPRGIHSVMGLPKRVDPELQYIEEKGCGLWSSPPYRREFKGMGGRERGI